MENLNLDELVNWKNALTQLWVLAIIPGVQQLKTTRGFTWLSKPILAWAGVALLAGLSTWLTSGIYASVAAGQFVWPWQFGAEQFAVAATVFGLATGGKAAAKTAAKK